MEKGIKIENIQNTPEIKDSDYLDNLKKVLNKLALTSALLITTFGAVKAQEKESVCTTKATELTKEEGKSFEQKASEIDSLCDVLIIKAKDYHLTQTEEQENILNTSYKSSSSSKGLVVFDSLQTKHTNSESYKDDIKIINYDGFQYSLAHSSRQKVVMLGHKSNAEVNDTNSKKRYFEIMDLRKLKDTENHNMSVTGKNQYVSYSSYAGHYPHVSATMGEYFGYDSKDLKNKLDNLKEVIKDEIVKLEQIQ